MIILWFRQDLRLGDNLALNYATSLNCPIIPVYILDNSSEPPLGEATKWWLYNSLKSLNNSLEEKLNFFVGNPKEILDDLISKHNATEITWNRCYEPYSIKRDKHLKEYLRSKNIIVKSFNSSLLLEPGETLKEDNTNYKVFTAFYKKHYAFGNAKIRNPISNLKQLNCLKINSSSLEELKLLPKIGWYKKFDKTWEAGEAGANKAFDEFFNNKLNGYKALRDRPDLEHSSKLSPHLHFGEISPNSIWHKVKNYIEKQGHNSDAEHFLSELVWREFSYNLLYFFPDLPTKNLQQKFDHFPWQYNENLLAKWQQGQTGYPIVDAGMRELWQTGFMHNRVRMITASFLVKHLLIDWREGEKWFWDCLVDADLANNSASWQWVAGSGADAAPYFRIFNPILQGEKFDPEGVYTRKYVPELKKLPIKYLFSPWLTPQDLLNKLDIKLGRDYPNPIIDHETARKTALAAYHEIKNKN